jgi:NADPH-dependent glutamate synthase beta subunit-like oxidoreductase
MLAIQHAHKRHRQDLRCDGHAVTLFEANDQAGGRLRYEFPDELPRETLDGEIDVMLQLDIDLRCGQRLGADLVLDQLRDQFEAVLVATGGRAADEAPCLVARLPVATAPFAPANSTDRKANADVSRAPA